MWTVNLCAWTITLSPTQKCVHQKKKKKKKKGKRHTQAHWLFQSDPNSHLEKGKSTSKVKCAKKKGINIILRTCKSGFIR